MFKLFGLILSNLYHEPIDTDIRYVSLVVLFYNIIPISSIF